MKHHPFIVERRLLLKGLFVFFFWLWNSSFTFPPQLKERIREKLSRLPYVGRFFPPPSPPKDLQEKAQKSLERTYWEGAPFYAPLLWKKAQNYYQKGQQALSQGDYTKARFYFQKTIETAQKAREQCLQKQHELKKRAEKKFAQIIDLWKRKEFPEKERLKWEIRIRYLKELLAKGLYEEFFREAEKMEEELLAGAKRKGPQKGPSPLKKNSS